MQPASQAASAQPPKALPTPQFPEREFPNLPSFEESLFLWKMEWAQRLPFKLRVFMASQLVLGLVLVVIHFHAATELLLSMQTAAGPTLSASTVRFGFGLFLLGWPIAYVPFVFATMPPRPTRGQHEKVLSLMRFYVGVKAVGVRSAEGEPGG